MREAVQFELVVTDQPVDEVAADLIRARTAQHHAGVPVDDGDGETRTAEVVEHERRVVAEFSGHLEHLERGRHFGDHLEVADLQPGHRRLHGTGLRLVLVRDADGLHLVDLVALGEHRPDGFGSQFRRPFECCGHRPRLEGRGFEAHGVVAREAHGAGAYRYTEN